MNTPRSKQFKLVFGGLLLAMLLASLDQTIVATALPTIVRDLGGLDQLSWVVTAYLLGATVSMPLWGRASDLYGRKPLFIAAIVVFLAGSALSGLAGTLSQLVAFRALQGLGAGGLMTLAMAIVGELVPPRERGRYQGYIQVVFIVASVAGPLLGGLFADHASWRWVFYVNLPIGAVALGLIATSLQLPVERVPVKLDYLGAALLAGSLTCLLLATTRGADALYAGFAVLLVAFVAQERRAQEPVLPLRLFRVVVFGLGFGLVSQVLTIAIQNAVDRRDLGIATASANLFRSLGGAVGIAAFGTVYTGASVFLYAAPVAIAGLLVVLLLEELPLGKAAVAR